MTATKRYCPKCKRPESSFEGPNGECLHGLAPAPEPWDGGASMTAEQVAEEYAISIEEAREIVGS